jgi:ATP-dependent helicase/nuclease subunit A
VSDRQPRFDFDASEAQASLDPLELRDVEARRLAVDPTRNVALEASAGTGKTRVLVDRYVALLLAGVKARNILAITFTRKAAAEMRQRILQELTRRHDARAISDELWREIRDSVAEIAISTIDAFCLALLREFPLEADIDPGFELADETETPQLVNAALDRTLRIARGLAASDPEVALLFADLGEFRLRQGLTRLIDRRLVAWDALNRYLRHAPALTIDDAVGGLLGRLRAAFSTIAGGAERLIATGPRVGEFDWFARDLRQLLGDTPPAAGAVQASLQRVREHLLTQDGQPRKRLLYKKADFRSSADYERHAAAVAALAPYVVDADTAYRRDINVVLARAARQVFAIAQQEYRKTLQQHGILDFTEVLQRTLQLLSRMDEFSRSRFKLESRFQHVLVDEFQDTSRAQWQLVELLVRSWAEGLGLSERHLLPSIFIVGDRKQSIYGFRDAEVAVLDEAGRYIEALRPSGRVRTAITRSFRSVHELLVFANDLFSAIDKAADRADAFRYSEDDAFPVRASAEANADAVGIVAARSEDDQAEAVAEEIAQLLVRGATVRDRETGVRRAVAPGDIAILFRTREGHQLFEQALNRRRVPYYVYKGLGFFDADEIKDVLALLGFLAFPDSELRAAALLRSRVIRLSDEALKLLAPSLCASMREPELPPAWPSLPSADRERLALARASMPQWLALADRLPPAELLDGVLADCAYAAEISGPRYRQARENLKKIRALIRRMQNRGYATVGRVVAHFEGLVAGGDESNAIIDAADAVNLMTVHAAKGLEFPIVFVVNMHRGSGGSRDAIRVTAPPPIAAAEPSVAVGEHVAAADEDAEAREAEESKRLLYVAVTRARDRLYVAASLGPDGRFVTGKGGLGRVLPAGVASLFAQAANTADAVVLWAGPTASHRLRVIGRAAEPTSVAPPTTTSPQEDHLGPLAEAVAPRALPVTHVVRRSDEDDDGGGGRSSPEIGTFVHGAVEGGWLRADVDTPQLVGALRRLASAMAWTATDDTIERAAAAMLSLRAQFDSITTADDPVVWHAYELPFSLVRSDGTVLRGAIDALTQRASGRVDVIEFKTGRRMAEHERQLDIYVEAARALFPGADVRGHVFYAGTGQGNFPRTWASN